MSQFLFLDTSGDVSNLILKKKISVKNGMFSIFLANNCPKSIAQDQTHFYCLDHCANGTENFQNISTKKSIQDQCAVHIFDTVYREMKCGIERGTLGDEPVYFATFHYYSSFVEEPCQLLFPFCELSCQMASNAFSNRVFVNI